MERTDLTNPEHLGAAWLRQSDIGIFTVDAEGQVVFVNEAMVKLLGSPDEKTPLLFNVLTLPTIPERIRERVIRTCLRDGKPRQADFPYVSMHGTRFAMRCHIYPFVEEGEVQGALFQVQDVSEWREIAEQLRRTSKMRSLSLLAGSLSHDLNNIFTTLLGFTSLLGKDRDLPRDRRERALRHIRTAAQSGANLVDQLLGFTSERRADHSASRFNDAFHQAVTLFSYGLPSNFQLEVNSELEDEWVEGSITKLEQIILNIALNAKDAIGHRDGRIRIHARHVMQAPNDAVPEVTAPERGFVHLAVEDNGEGMAPEVLSRIFDPYFTTKEPGRGTGLGLSSVWGLLQELGGCVRVTSEVSKGTLFDIYLPLATRRLDSPIDRAPVLHSLVGQGERVLVAEADPDLRELLVWVLLKNGYKALAAQDLEEALDVLDQMGETTHVIVLDIPLTTAEQELLAERVKTLQLRVLKLKGAPMKGLTGLPMMELRKPFLPTEYLEALGKLLL